MKKTTFYVLATFCGLGSLFLALVVWLVFFEDSGGSPKSFRVKQDIQFIGNAIKSYAVNAGRCPTTSQGVDALVKKPKAGPKPRRWVQIMRAVPLDPWQTPYRYTLLRPKECEWRWELRSAGPNRIFGDRDDLATEDESGRKMESIEEEPEAETDSRPSF